MERFLTGLQAAEIQEACSFPEAYRGRQVYRWLAKAEDAGAVGRARTQVAQALHGRLLVVGLGPAADLHHLPEQVTEVVGVEPSRSMRRVAAGGSGAGRP